MTLNNDLLNVYFHMNNHYRKLKNVKSCINSRSSTARNTPTNGSGKVSFRSDRSNSVRPPTRRHPKDMPKPRSKSSMKTGIADDKDKKASSIDEKGDLSSEKKHDKKGKHEKPAKRLILDDNTVQNATGAVSQHEYLHFSLRITEDIIKNDLYTNAQMKQVFNSHFEANRGRLDETQMTIAITELCQELNIPLDDTIGTSNKEALTSARVKLCTKSTSHICICSNTKLPEACICSSARDPPIKCSLHPEILESPKDMRKKHKSLDYRNSSKSKSKLSVSERKSAKIMDSVFKIREANDSNFKKDNEKIKDGVRLKEDLEMEINDDEMSQKDSNETPKLLELEYIKKPKELCPCGSDTCIPSDCEEDSGLVDLEVITTKTNLDEIKEKDRVFETHVSSLGAVDEVNDDSSIAHIVKSVKPEKEVVKAHTKVGVSCCDSESCNPGTCIGNIEEVDNKCTDNTPKAVVIPEEPIIVEIPKLPLATEPKTEPNVISKIDCKCGVDTVEAYLEYFNKQMVPPKHLRQLEITSFSTSIEPKVTNKKSEATTHDKKEDTCYSKRRSCCCGNSTEDLIGCTNIGRLMEGMRSNSEKQNEDKSKNICNAKNQQHPTCSTKTVERATCTRGITQHEIDKNGNNYILLEGPVYVPRQLIEKNNIMSLANKADVTNAKKHGFKNVCQTFTDQAPVKLPMEAFKLDTNFNRCDYDMTPQREYVNNQPNMQYTHCQSKCIMQRNTDLLLGNQYIKNCNNSMANIAHFYPTIATQVSSLELLKYATETNESNVSKKKFSITTEKPIIPQLLPKNKNKSNNVVNQLREDVRSTNPMQPLNDMSDNRFLDIISSYQVIEPMSTPVRLPSNESDATPEDVDSRYSPDLSDMYDAPLLAILHQQQLNDAKPKRTTIHRDEDVMQKLDRIPPLIHTDSMDSNMRKAHEEIEKYRHGEEFEIQIPKPVLEEQMQTADKIKRASISEEVELINIRNRDDIGVARNSDGKYRESDDMLEKLSTKQKPTPRKQSTFLPTTDDGNKLFSDANYKSNFASGEDKRMSEVSAQVYAIRQKNK